MTKREDWLLEKRGFDTARAVRELLKKQAEGDVEEMPVDIMLFFCDRLAEAAARLTSASEHRSFVKSTGVYDSDYFDAGYDRDGRLEDQGELQRAAREGKLAPYRDDFDRWWQEQRERYGSPPER